MRIIIIIMLSLCCTSILSIAQLPIKSGTKVQSYPNGTYSVKESSDKEFKLFKSGDILKIDTQNGLRHYRSNKLLRSYKTIPAILSVNTVLPCEVPPCAECLQKVKAYYIVAIKRYISISDLSNKSYLNITPAGYTAQDPESHPLQDYQMEFLYLLKKQKQH